MEAAQTMINRGKVLVGLLLSVILIVPVVSWIRLSISEKPIWSVSIYAGTGPFDLHPHPLVPRHPAISASDITDAPSDFVADPFMVCVQNRWYMFFETLTAASGQGDIALASSDDGIHWRYERIVLDEPFHLSYPYVFEWNGAWYMIPESRDASSVRLYRSDAFPFEWRFAGELISGAYSDPSIVFKDGRWWLFVLKDLDTLLLFQAENLSGPWTEHPRSPLVLRDRNVARPGGRMIVYQDRIIRYAQDGDPVYGIAIRAFVVDEITPETYREHEVLNAVLPVASGRGWNAAGMHNIDPHQTGEGQWIACVDGKRKSGAFEPGKGARRLLDRIRRLANF